MTSPVCQMKRRTLLEKLNWQSCSLRQPFVTTSGTGKLYDWGPFGMLQVDSHSLTFNQSSNTSLIWNSRGLSGPLFMLEVNGSFPPVFDKLWRLGLPFFLVIFHM